MQLLHFFAGLTLLFGHVTSEVSQSSSSSPGFVVDSKLIEAHHRTKQTSTSFTLPTLTSRVRRVGRGGGEKGVARKAVRYAAYGSELAEGG